VQISGVAFMVGLWDLGRVLVRMPYNYVVARTWKSRVESLMYRENWTVADFSDKSGIRLSVLERILSGQRYVNMRARGQIRELERIMSR